MCKCYDLNENEINWRGRYSTNTVSLFFAIIRPGLYTEQPEGGVDTFSDKATVNSHNIRLQGLFINTIKYGKNEKM